MIPMESKPALVTENACPPIIWVGGKYKLGMRIGSGDLYLARNIVTQKMFAVKLESIYSDDPQLEHEAVIYRKLSADDGAIGFPRVHWFGASGECNTMVVDRLGPSLEELFNSCGRKFTISTVLLIAQQMLDRLEYLHSKHYVHGDIKPENILIGVDDLAHRIFLIDFGLARQYRDPSSRTFYPCSKGQGVNGTARYASINNHYGIAQTPRGGLESLLYLLLYFLRGRLPWQGIRAASSAEVDLEILARKEAITVKVLCRGHPREFSKAVKYVRSLASNDQPDYHHLRQLFLTAQKRGTHSDAIFEWSNAATSQP